MSNSLMISNLATRLSTECKSLRTLINGNAADLSSLSTTAKTSLVAAINELDAALDAVSGGAAGIDDGVTSASSTWSSTKVAGEISASATSTLNTILGGAGAAYDTLAELKALLDASDSADDAALASITTALGNRLRIDAAQGLTAPQQQQGRDNLDVYSKAEIGNPETNYVTVFEAGLL